jgi:subtilisin-like proprotein convertase family protein
LFCDSFNNSIAIPDNNPGGIIDTIQIADTRIIVDLDVVLNIKHTWVGDLVARLTHVESGKSIDLIHRPGVPASDQGCWNNNVAAILDDDISSGVEGKCASEPAAISGIYIPNQALSVFDGDSIAGSWQLNVSDNSINDTGSLNGWCVVGKISTYGQTPPPPPPPPPVAPPGVN